MLQLKTKDRFGNYPSWRKKPYGVRIEFNTDGEYFVDKEETLPSFVGIRDEACILLSETYIFHLAHDKVCSKREEKNIWNIYIEGFTTASEAERAGKQFATALIMFNSVMYLPCVRIRYSLPEPYEVYSRRSPDKPKTRNFIKIKDTELNQKRRKSIDNLRKTWLLTEGSNISERLYTALELYTSAQFENSDRAKFIGIISVIESLAIQKDYSQNEGYDITSIINKLCKELNTCESIPEPIMKSLEGQIKNLKRESVRQACRRLIKLRMPKYNNAMVIFDQAYSARSKLLHEGEMPINFGQISFEIEDLVRSLLITFLPSK